MGGIIGWYKNLVSSLVSIVNHRLNYLDIKTITHNSGKTVFFNIMIFEGMKLIEATTIIAKTVYFTPKTIDFT